MYFISATVAVDMADIYQNALPIDVEVSELKSSGLEKLKGLIPLTILARFREDKLQIERSKYSSDGP